MGHGAIRRARKSWAKSTEPESLSSSNKVDLKGDNALTNMLSYLARIGSCLLLSATCSHMSETSLVRGLRQNEMYTKLPCRIVLFTCPFLGRSTYTDMTPYVQNRLAM